MDKDTSSTDAPKNDSQAPADALSMTPEELGKSSSSETPPPSTSPQKTKAKRAPSKIGRFLRRANVYFLLFLILLVVAAAIAVVTYLNSQKVTPEVAVNSQQLSADTLKQLANTDASVGSSNQTLTIKGSAVINGHTLLRSGLDVAGTLQTSGKITGPSLTIAGDTNLGATQTKRLQADGTIDARGDITTSGALSVAGSSTFSGPLTAAKITASELILSGNARLQVPNHIGFDGPSPRRSISPAVLGAGGTVSVNGSDTTGSVNINSGARPSAGCFVTVSFNRQYATTPHVLVSPINAAAGKLNYYVTKSATGFKVCSATPATAHAHFSFDYFVTS